ncbi:MAG: substrate-binding domain-containing protein [Phycisphaerales bacterium]|nr:substrate-binding domain-containing protein [Phycisphaerales bacterium]
MTHFKMAGMLAATMAMMFVLQGCGQGESGPPATQIAVIPKGTSHEFWKAVHSGAAQRARESDGTVEIIWKGPAREDDRDDQIKVVEQFVTKGVDGIVIAPLDDTALVRPLKEAKDEGIPVVVFDSGINWDGYESYIATNNFDAGRSAAHELARQMGGRGNVVVMRYVEGSASTTQREEGFLDIMRSDYPDITILTDNQFGGATLEGCYATAENLLDKYQQFDGAYAPCEPVTVAFMRALDQSGRKGDTRLVGFDASQTLVEGLESGKVDALMVQSPFQMGYQSVAKLIEKLEGREIPREVDTGVAVITRANMNEPANQALLNPPSEDNRN